MENRKKETQFLFMTSYQYTGKGLKIDTQNIVEGEAGSHQGPGSGGVSEALKRVRVHF